MFSHVTHGQETIPLELKNWSEEQLVEYIETGNEGLSKLADALKLCTFDPLQFPHGGLYFEVEEFAEAFDRARGTSRAFPVAVVHANFIIGLPH